MLGYALARDQINADRYIASPRNTPLCNLYVSMEPCMGAETQRFGDSTEPLRGLMV